MDERAPNQASGRQPMSPSRERLREVAAAELRRARESQTEIDLRVARMRELAAEARVFAATRDTHIAVIKSLRIGYPEAAEALVEIDHRLVGADLPAKLWEQVPPA